MDGVAQDARHLARSLVRSPGFAIIAVVTLALGIGMTTAVVSIVDHVLLRSLPFRQPDRLMMLLERDEHGGIRPPSFPTVEDWARDPGTRAAFEGVTFIRGDGVALTTHDGPERIVAGFVSADFFPLLGVAPLLGRTLGPDDQRLDAPPVVVLSYALWQSRFGGDRSIVGQRVTLDSLSTTVVGVLPVGAAYPTFAQIWQPLSHYRHQDIVMRRGLHVDSRTLGRLRPGVDSARAAVLMRVVGARLAAAYPAEQAHWSAATIPLQLEIVGDVKPMLLTLAGAAGVVLLLACANVANLLLARMSTRSRELAVRSALGGSRGRIVRQLVTESLMLVGAGGALGLGIAVAAIRLGRELLASRLPRAEELVIDGRVMVVAAIASLVTVVLCGVWPAIRATRADSGAMLRTGTLAAVGGRGESRLRRALVTVQFALALMLLVGAGLLLQSFRRVADVPIGFDPNGLVTVAISPPVSAYGQPAQAAALYDRLMVAMRAVPGVTDAAVINHFPFTGSSIMTPVEIEGRSSIDTTSNDVLYRTVSDRYLSTMKMSLAAGRWFTASDMRSRGGGFVINETMARRFWPGESAVGKRFTIRRSSQARADFGQRLSGAVIGVIHDVRQFQQEVAPSPEVYVPYTLEVWPWATLVTRTRDGARAIPALRRAVLAVEPQLVLTGGAAGRGYSTVDALIDASLEQRRLTMMLIGVFAGCALVLAAIGMYGVIAFGITQRTRELGVRKALGATDGMIAALVLRESLTLTAAGVAFGCLGAWGSATLIRGLLYDTGPADPVAYLGTIALLIGVALLATYVPARRATQLDPTVAIRGE
jgi:putative ABC transport system permease protein